MMCGSWNSGEGIFCFFFVEESYVSVFFVNSLHQRINEIKKNSRSGENT
jgi:hypothetical protein